MTGVVESYLKFNYALRPSKQVERKLLVEALLRLRGFGYPITEYTYLGFGSVYYADFQVFNRYLYMDKMVCVEGGAIPKRMEFNKPFGGIDLQMSMLSDVIPSLDRDTRYFAWLDYDVPLGEAVLQDVRSLASLLCPGSVLLVTVDAEARVRFEPPLQNMTGEDLQALRASEINEGIAAFVEEPVTAAQYNNADLPTVFASALRNAITDEATMRGDVSFCQLFNFRYRDGAQMLSIGGIIDAPNAIDALTEQGYLDWPHFNTAVEPLEISIPPLTPREKQYLDRWVTMTDPPELLFELDEAEVADFRQYRRHYPQYFESLL